MISASDHDVVYLSVGAKDLNETATEEDIITILRCGVYCDFEHDCLVMYT